MEPEEAKAIFWARNSLINEEKKMNNESIINGEIPPSKRLKTNYVEWISVKDKMPPSGMEHLLIISDGGGVSLGYYQSKWIDDCKILFDTPPKVTHWMPVPDLPIEIDVGPSPDDP